MLRKLKKSERLHLVISLIIAIAVLLPLVVKAETMYLFEYDHTGVILWGYPYFESWQDTRAQELTDHPPLKTGIQMSGYEVEWYANNRPIYLSILYNRIHNQFSGRYGLANAVYSDSFGNMVLSESNAKNFYYGKKPFKKYLGYDVNVYATQEATLFAALPSVLAATEYDYMLHRTSNGYGNSSSMPTPNYSTVWVEGPEGDGVVGGSDGLKAVPEYNGADVSPYNPIRDKSDYLLSDYYKNGITTLTDVKGYHTEYYNASTNQYVLGSALPDGEWNPLDKLAHDTAGDSWTWYFMVGEDFATTFPAPTQLWNQPVNNYKTWGPWGRWGNEVFSSPRNAEINVLNAERIAAINKMIGGTNSYESDLDTAWKNVLAAQHHDLIAVSDLPDGYLEGPDNDRFGGGYVRPRVTASLNASNAVISGAMTSIASLVNSSIGYKILVVANPDAADRRELVDVVLGSGFATPFAIFDGANEIAYEQIDATNHEVVFFVDLPSLGYKTITIKNQSPTVTPTGMTVNTSQRTVSTNYYDIKFGSPGGITKLYDKTISQHILKYNGTFSARFRGKINGTWSTSSGTISFPTVGKLMTKVKDTGSIGGIPYTTYITIYNELRRIDFKTTFTFNGQEISVTTECPDSDPRFRAFWDDGKLGVLFQADYTNPSVNTDRPFVVAAGQNSQPPYASQHSTGPVAGMVGLTWADLTASDSSRGFAVFNKGTMGYRSPYVDLTNSTVYTDILFMPFAWRSAGVDNGRYGDYTYEYALYGHTGDWKTGNVHKSADEYNFRAQTKLDNPHTGSASATKSLFKPSSSNVIVSGVYTKSRALYARIWEFEGTSASVNLQSADYTWYAYNTNMLHNNPTSVSQPISMTHNKIRTLFITTDANVQSNVPAQVTGVTVTQVSGSKLNLSWTAGSETDLRHYNIYRSTTSGFTPSESNKIAEEELNSYSDTGLNPTTTYYYKVEAEDLFGNKGPYSAQASGTTGAANGSYDCIESYLIMGSVISGNHINLHANDGSYLQIASGGVVTKETSWEAWASLDKTPDKVTRLDITYDGKYSTSVTQTLQLWNFTTGAWEQIDVRTVGTTDTTITWSTTNPTTIQKYISNYGDIRLNIYAAKFLSSFTCYGDYVRYYIEYTP